MNYASLSFRIAQEPWTKAFISLAAVVLTIAAFSGCGSESSGDSHSASTFDVRADTTMTVAAGLTQAAVIAHMDRACTEAWQTIRHNYREYGSAQDPRLSEKERTADAIRQSLMAGIDFHIFDELHLLGAPPGEETRLERIIGAMQEAVERGQRLGPLYSVSEAIALFSDFNKQASRYGLNDCLVNKAHLRLP